MPVHELVPGDPNLAKLVASLLTEAFARDLRLLVDVDQPEGLQSQAQCEIQYVTLQIVQRQLKCTRCWPTLCRMLSSRQELA